MTQAIKYLFLIPARGGSQRLPGKNIKLISGLPLIAWTINAAKHATKNSEVLVSTDSEEIKGIAETYGANVPFLRPQHLSNATASSVDVAIHALEYYKSKGICVENLVLLQPTSPLRDERHIREAISLFENENLDAVISVCPAEHSPLWANALGENDSLEGFIRPEVKNMRSQDLPTYYRINGAIYLVKAREFQKQKSFFVERNVKAYKMSTESSVDIDTYLDFELAQLLMNKKRNEDV